MLYHLTSLYFSFLFKFYLSNLYTQNWAQTQNPEIKSCLLFWASQTPHSISFFFQTPHSISLFLTKMYSVLALGFLKSIWKSIIIHKDMFQRSWKPHNTLAIMVSKYNISNKGVPLWNRQVYLSILSWTKRQNKFLSGFTVQSATLLSYVIKL